MVEETVGQLKRLHAIEDVEQAIFALERGIPVPPRVIETLRVIFRVMADEYNREFAPRAPTAQGSQTEEPATYNGDTTGAE